MADFDPDAYLGTKAASTFNPDEYLKQFDPDAYLGTPVEKDRATQTPMEFLKNSALGNIPLGIAKGGDFALRGLDTAAAAAAGAFGFDNERDRILRESDARSRSLQQFTQEQGGQGKAAELGQGIGSLPAMVNPITGIPAAIGGITDLQRTLDEQGVDPESAAGAAKRQAIANTVLGALPFANISRLAGAGVNVGSGAFADWLTNTYLKEKGYGKIADETFDWSDLTQRAIDALGGAAVTPTRPAKPGKPKAKDIKESLDTIDVKNADHELGLKEQSQTTMYVGQDGTAADTLGTKVVEDPAVADLARTQMQNELSPSPWEPAQPDMFPIQTNATQGLMDLRTEPDRSGLARQEDLTGLPLDRKPGTTPYDIIPEDPRPRARKEALESDPNSPAPSFIARPEEIKPWIQRVIEIEEQGNKLTHLSKEEREKWKVAQRTAERENRFEWFKDYGDQIKLDPSLIKEDGTTDVGDVLKSVLNDPEAARIRPDLVGLVKDLAPFIGDLKLTVRSEADVVSGKNKDGTDRQVPGFYNRAGHYMELGQNGYNVRIFMHELVHAATSRALDAFVRADGKFTSKAPPAVRSLQKILDHLRSLAIDMGEKGWYFEGASIYGLTDLHEFAAEIKTNRYLQNMMREMSPIAGLGAGKNVLQQWWGAVKKMLGVSKSPVNTLFDQAASLTGEIAKFQAENPALINSAMKQKWGNHKNYRELTNSPSPEASKSLSNAAPTKVDAEDSKSNVIEDVTGIQHVAKDPVVDEALIEKIQGEKDGSTMWAMTPGALARAITAKSTLVLTGYRLMDNASKRIAYQTKKIIAPVEKTIVKVLQSDEKAEILHDLFMRELSNKRDYDPDELRTAGVSEELIMAHLEFRTMMEGVREQQNIALADKGLPPVDKLQSFITSRWSGPWRANIRDADGNIVWQIAEHSRRGANQALKHIMERQPGLKADDILYRQGRERSDSVEAGYNEMLKLVDPDDPRTQALQSIYEEYILGKTENVAQQEKHFLRKTGVRGYAGDRPWSKEDAKDMFVQQFEYAKNAVKWSEYQKAVDKLKPLIHDPSLQESQKNNIAYLKEYSKNHLGFGTAELFSRLDNAVAKFLGVSPDTLQSGMGAAKTYFYLSRLGLSIPFTITQFIQPAITTPAWHSQLTSEGFKHNPVYTSVMGTVNGFGAAYWHYMKLLGGDTKLVEALMDGVDKDAVRWMEANGIVEINPLADIKKDLRPQIVKQVSAPFEFTIKHSEIIARSVAFMAFVTHLKQSGVYDLDSAKGRAELFQKAEDMTKISMTDYRPTERAIIFERGGLIGDGAATLHSYQINNLFQLWNFSKEFKNGNPKPLMNMMFMQFLAAGALGLWFIDDLDDLLDQFKKWLPHDDYMYWKDKSIKNFILQNSNDFVAYGGVSALTGTNMHTRMSAADQIPIWPFEPADLTSAKGVGKSILDMAGNAFPFAGTTGSTLAAPVQAARNIPTRDKLEAAYAGAPAVAQGPMENLPAYNIGNKSRNPTDFSRPPILRTQEEKNLRNLGLRSTREQRQKDKDYMNSKVEKEMQRRMQTAHERAISHILDGNTKQGVAEAIKYVDLGGDVATVLQSIPKARIREATTELERRALEAGSGTKASILKLKRYLDNVEK